MSGSSNPPAQPGNPPAVDPKDLWKTGRLILLVCLALVALLVGVLLFGKGTTGQPPFNIGILGGFVLLIVALAGLVLIFQVLGLSSPNDAFGLPPGSIRALLALALVIVFVAVCATDLGGNQLTDSDGFKQILSISATALTTVIGFYFGSNSATDTMGKLQQAMSGNAPNSDDPSNVDDPSVPITIDALTAQAAALKTMADSLQAKFSVAATPSIDDIAKSNPDANALAILRAKASDCTAAITAAGVDRDRAAQAIQDAQSANGDQTKLQAASDRLTQLTTDCLKEQAAFAAALTAFTTQRDLLLKSIAQG